MEISDGPIIMDNCCLNCIHSVEHRGGIACGDRGWFLRLFLGLRQIERPNVANCNKFEPIPSPIAKQCRYCEHYGIHHEMTSCYNMGLGDLIVRGPYIVTPTDKCADFALKKCYQQRKWNGR